MKVIFLDVDGVLNSNHYFDKVHKKRVNGKKIPSCDIDERFVKNLKWLVEKTGAKIVLSSSWRILIKRDNNHYLHKILAKYGLTIFDYTPYTGIEKGADIQEWLNRNSFCYDVTNIVILDDEDDMRHLKNYLVQTNFMPVYIDKKERVHHLPLLWRFLEGLTKSKCRQALKILDKIYDRNYEKQEWVRKNSRKHF